MDDFDFDVAADTGERAAYEQGAAEARAMADDPEGAVQESCAEEAMLAREIARDRAEVAGALLALLDACESSGADVGLLRSTTDALVAEMSELVIDRDAPDGTMARVEDDPVRLHCRRSALKIEALARRAPQIASLLQTPAFRLVSGNTAVSPVPAGKVSLEW
eukprot:CAMPEP_0174829334 /NCGR_PEP_ID=MMETSP1114-20130205/1874_1 /TAXON_ID=312471 /ORGANISM="Neobodo designis, Strain CCAP 1951/1" /LENGTH=162 /DNA_ID=CAMNT_0016063079 /DNA_START=52 /DNA_END=537 /DNA_ORIENTATION=+